MLVPNSHRIILASPSLQCKYSHQHSDDTAHVQAFPKKVEAPSASVAEFFVHSITFTRQTRLNPNITSPTVQQRTAYTVIQTRRMDHQHCLLHASFRQSSCSMQNAIDQRHSQMSLADIHWPALGSNGYSTRSAQPLTLQR